MPRYVHGFGSQPPGPYLTKDWILLGLVPQTWRPTGNGQVFVALQGAPANQGYDVQFERLNDHGREDLGTVTTDGNGNFNGMTPNGLGGNGNRVGSFVLIRNGQDQFVSCI